LDPKDNEILQLISSSRIEMNDNCFEAKCMKFIKEQSDADTSYSFLHKMSSWFYIVAIVICFVLIALGLFSSPGDMIPAVLLQAFAIGVASYIIMSFKGRPHIPQ